MAGRGSPVGGNLANPNVLPLRERPTPNRPPHPARRPACRQDAPTPAIVSIHSALAPVTSPGPIALARVIIQLVVYLRYALKVDWSWECGHGALEWPWPRWLRLAQLTGVPMPTGLVSMILEAVRTVSQNREECRHLVRRVMMIGDLMQKLQGWDMMQEPEIRRPLDGLDDTLREAYVLIVSCQKL
ncbi:hypothetical protein HU200_058281 [Digitaria exilis]|uniref:MCAfunc domain-containing protein n=1 Tax=Digitaria exilis TaxID=1010633 RepID=A0A835DZ72_9POAL|nr:hypothetical protein HU200_058281 [Digitaria exilis]